MIGRLRRMLARIVAPRPPLPALPSTRPTLNATRSQHERTIRKADAVLRDWKRFDGALRVTVIRR